MKYILFFIALLIMGCADEDYLEVTEINNPSDKVFRTFEGRDTLNLPYETLLRLTCPPIDTVRIGLIGVGSRGLSAVYRLSRIPGVKIIALSDLVDQNLNRATNLLIDQKKVSPVLYNEPDDWKKICLRDDVNLIYIATPWNLHAEIANFAMRNNKHVAVEVPAALSIKECWSIIETAEETRKHCIMLENCIYGENELASLNMTRHNLVGEIFHVEGKYIHDLSKKLLSEDGYWNQWRLKALAQTEGNPYPTHAIGPIAQAIGIHRGDRLKSLVSLSSDEFSLSERSEYLEKELPDEYNKGDINTTVIKTAMGKTILLQHGTASPRPYSRGYEISGTKGYISHWPISSVTLGFDPIEHFNNHQADSIFQDYFPKNASLALVEGIKESQHSHLKMDFLMDYRLVYCLRNGLPLDMDVYDLAEWCSIIELSKISSLNGGKPVEIPDFTRGNWDVLDTAVYFLAPHE